MMCDRGMDCIVKYIYFSNIQKIRWYNVKVSHHRDTEAQSLYLAQGKLCVSVPLW